MAEIRLITKEDIPNLKYRNMDWDVEVKGVPYQVIKVDGFVHCIGGHLDWGEGNDFWAFPLHDSMTIDTLVEFNGEPGPAWGIEYSPTNYIKTKWGETEIRQGRKLIITRNGKPFYDGMVTFHQAIAYIKDGILDEHPLELNRRYFDERCIFRKIWYRSEPAVITSYINGQACIMIKPDPEYGLKEFSTPREFEGELHLDEDRTELKVSIFDEHVWWFRS